MAELIRERWSCSNNKVVRRRVHSDGKEDEIEAYKILRQKNKIDKSRAIRDL